MLVVSEHCGYCQQVLEEFHEYGFTRPVIVVKYESCPNEVDHYFADENALPLIAHFSDGRIVRKAVGVDGIKNFERS